MNNTDFLKLDASGKVAELIERVKTDLVAGKPIIPTFYFFDDKEKAYVVEIMEPFLLKSENKHILRSIVKEKLKDLKAEKKTIEQILFLQEGYYSKNHPNKSEMNLDNDFHAGNSNEALIISLEDHFDFKLKIYDVIKIEDKGTSFMVLSKDPIEDIDFCKISPDTNVKTTFINLL